MSSLSFDRVAMQYDATRGYPPDVAQRIAVSIEKAACATEETRFIEVGVGTGRIAVPVAGLSHIYTGVDISRKMMDQLEAKLQRNGWKQQDFQWGTSPDEDPDRPSWVQRFIQPQKHASMRLISSDITDLPLADASFDVAVGVHIFHLVDNWQKAVNEALRVLRPGSFFLHCWDDYEMSDTMVGFIAIRRKWWQIMVEMRGESSQTSAALSSRINDFLRQKGLNSEEIREVQWQTSHTPREVLDGIAKRVWSGTWDVPDDLFAESIQRLEQWVHEQFGDEMDTPVIQNAAFLISRTQV